MLVPNLGATVTTLVGCLGVLFPTAVSRVLGIEATGLPGISELRATYGGFFLCLGMGCLAAQSPPVFMVVGQAWCAAAVARLVSFAIDGSRSHRNVAGIVFEASVGLAMLSAAS